MTPRWGLISQLVGDQAGKDQSAKDSGQAKAKDPAELFNTPVPAERHDTYQKWLTELPANLRGTADYDLQGAFLAGAKPEGGHLTDQFKKPNHMTFSTDSMYSGHGEETGGRWVKSGDGTWTFYASPTNLKYHSAQELQDYFRRYEPASKLVLPAQPKASGK